MNLELLSDKEYEILGQIMTKDVFEDRIITAEIEGKLWGEGNTTHHILVSMIKWMPEESFWEIKKDNIYQELRLELLLSHGDLYPERTRPTKMKNANHYK